MLTEKAKQLTERIGQLKVLKQQATLAGQYRTRANALDTPAKSLAELGRSIAWFRQQGLQIDLPAKLVQTLRVELDSLAADYQAKSESITQPDADRRTKLWDPLKVLPSQIETALKQAWSNHVQQTLPTGQPDLLNVLQQLPGFTTQVAKIRALQQVADQLAGSLPTPDGFDNLNRQAGVLRQAWAELPTGGISPEILTFLRAATQRQATLDLVTPAVSDWLKRHHLLKAFKVIL